MALQLSDYANIKQFVPNRGYMGDILGDVLEGYKMSQVPKQLQQEQQQRDLASQLAQMKLQYQPQEYEANIASKQAEALMNQQKAQQLKNSQDYLRQLLGGQDGTQQDLTGVEQQSGASNTFRKEQLERAKNAAALGDMKQLVKILTEQDISKTPQSPLINKVQQQNLAIDNVVPILKELRDFEVPGQGMGYIFSPSNQAKYESLASSAVESLVTAFDFLNTDKGLKEAKNIVVRKPRENLKSYRARLDKEIEKLLDRKQKNTQITQVGSVNSLQQYQPYKDEDLEYTAKKYNVSIEKAREMLEEDNAS